VCETTESRSPIDAHLIALDETGLYFFPKEHVPYIDQILAVYLYDANERTHLCEMTPSHFMRFLHHVIHLTKAGRDLSDEQREALYNVYEIENPNVDQYMHCRTLERLAAAGTPKNYDHHGATEVSYDDSDYDEQIEDLIEYFNGNPPF